MGGEPLRTIHLDESVFAAAAMRAAPIDFEVMKAKQLSAELEAREAAKHDSDGVGANRWIHARAVNNT